MKFLYVIIDNFFLTVELVIVMLLALYASAPYCALVCGIAAIIVFFIQLSIYIKSIYQQRKIDKQYRLFFWNR